MRTKHIILAALIAALGCAKASKPSYGRAKGVASKNWKYIVLHHSATDAGSVESFDKYHREKRGWNGIGYHFVIGNGNGSADGVIKPTYRWKKQLTGAHAGSVEYNKFGIGICLVGDFSKTKPTKKQQSAILKLVKELSEQYKIPKDKIIRHSDINKTSCPGGQMPWPLEI